ncbi:MAG TPA: hypothetical protein VGH65_01025, partial [Verrucomicrobiaceae bacterium]
MTNSIQPSSDNTREITRRALSGWPLLVINIAIVLSGAAMFLCGILDSIHHNHFSWLAPASALVEAMGVISLCGHFTLQPNEARVLILFGGYHGTARESGFFWANPFYSRVRRRVPLSGADAVPTRNPNTGHISVPQRTLSTKISLRARNFISDKLKVNDKRG